MKQRSAIRTQPSDCIACVLYPVLKTGCICGPTAIMITCTHSKKPTLTATFEVSRVLLAIHFLLIFPLVASISLSIKDSLATEDFNTKIAQTKDILSYIPSVAIIIIGVFKSNEKVIELNGLSSIINNKSYYGFHALIDKKRTKCLLWKSYIMLFLLLLMMIIFFVFTIYQQTKSKVTLTVLQMFVFPVAFLNQTLMFNQCFTSVLLYRLLFRKCCNQLQDVLSKHLNKSAKIESFINMKQSEENPKQDSLETSLKRLKMFYTSLIENYKQLNSFMQPSLLLNFLFSVIVIVFDCYTVVQIYANVVEVDPVSEMRSIIAMLSVPVFFIVNEQVYSVVSIYVVLSHLN